MREQPDLSDAFEKALEAHGYAGAELDRIETRLCGSDNYDGREYSFYGSFIPLRPIIDVAKEQQNFAIEEFSFIDESTEENHYEPHVSVFVADLRDEQSHPAFAPSNK